MNNLRTYFYLPRCLGKLCPATKGIFQNNWGIAVVRNTTVIVSSNPANFCLHDEPLKWTKSGLLSFYFRSFLMPLANTGSISSIKIN